MNREMDIRTRGVTQSGVHSAAAVPITTITITSISALPGVASITKRFALKKEIYYVKKDKTRDKYQSFLPMPIRGAGREKREKMGKSRERRKG